MSKTWKINTDEISEPRRGSKKFAQSNNRRQKDKKKKRSVKQRGRFDTQAWIEAYA